MSDLWIFGYGSLMWNPGFAFDEATPARVHGVHRALCIYSWVHRGTQQRPGLVLGLDTGGSCLGMAFRVPGHAREDALAYLRERELVTAVYFETRRSIFLADGQGAASALTYQVDRSHQQYAGRLSPEEQLDLVRHAEGRAGRNTDYVINTARHLRELGVRDHGLEWLTHRLGDAN